ncbi:DNA adenine methylase [Pectobacterium sp. B1J-3]|uniref:DNA adenine methylase n=1 Tax=Pectobacterium sp. B1J-3 TaxID=3385371 RepID=UPI003905D8AE
MSQTPSPLRYPGGKTAIIKMIHKIIYDNGLQRCGYSEPYAGGCGLALSLLFKGYVHKLNLNDYDRSIWAFWHSILHDTERFVKKIIDTEVTLDEWYKQREIQKNKNQAESFELGFSTFFMNRTNRSGIILKAGVIGGFHQSGKYKIDCRFTKKNLIDKINRISLYKNKISIHNLDAVDFLKKIDEEESKNNLFFIDPPYFVKGSTLYTNFYEKEDHRILYNEIIKLKSPWLLTYDNAPEIKELYESLIQYTFSLKYSAADKKIGTELLIPSADLHIDHSELGIHKINSIDLLCTA